MNVVWGVCLGWAWMGGGGARPRGVGWCVPSLRNDQKYLRAGQKKEDVTRGKIEEGGGWRDERPNGRRPGSPIERPGRTTGHCPTRPRACRIGSVAPRLFQHPNAALLRAPPNDLFGSTDDWAPLGAASSFVVSLLSHHPAPPSRRLLRSSAQPIWPESRRGRAAPDD